MNIKITELTRGDVNNKEVPIIDKRLELTKTEEVIYNLRGKYIKQTLARIELFGGMTPAIRKEILDGFNDYCRELTKELGYESRD